MKLNPVTVARAWFIFAVVAVLVNVTATILGLIQGAWLLAAWCTLMTIVGLWSGRGIRLKLMQAKHAEINKYEPL